MRLGSLGLVATLSIAGSLRAQEPTELLGTGLRAYRELDYDRAVGLFRRALLAGRPAFGDSARAGAWVYLGAAHLFQERSDSAATAFRSALAADPRVRPDTLIFPPTVLTAFERVRRTTAYVAVAVPSDTTVPGDGRYLIRLYASMPHRAEVRLTAGDPSRSKEVFAGMLGDSTEVQWAPRDSLGAMPPPGSATLEVISRPDSGAANAVRIPLELARVGGDTAALPIRPVESSGPIATTTVMKPGPFRFRSLAAGVVPGVAVVLLPKLLAIDGGGNSARFAIGGALGIAGVVGFVSGRTLRPQAIAAPPPRGPSPIAAWQRAVDSLHVENERRARSVALRIRRVGEPPALR